jgi:hypothetical protein
MFVIYLFTKFHILCSSALFVITIILKAKSKLFVAAILFYILQKYDLNRSSYIFKYFYYTKFQGPALSGTSVISTLQIHTATIWYYWWEEIKRYKGGLVQSSVVFIPDFSWFRQKLYWGQTYMDMMIA